VRQRSLFDSRDDPEGLRIPLESIVEAQVAPSVFIEYFLTDMTEGGMTQIVGQRCRLHDMDI
jgi:hypothetical protein